jgi:hypothetical protein
MIQVVEYEVEHALLINLQAAQRQEIGADYAQMLKDGSEAVTGLVGDKVLFCIGKIKVWPGRNIVWALISVEAKRYMKSITKIARQLWELQRGEGRFEAYVRSHWPQGWKWAELVGMKWEGHQQRFFPDGGDAETFVRFC